MLLQNYFSKLNWNRCIDPKGFNDPNISILYLAVCLGEEVGEIQGVIKKIERGFNERERKKEKLRWFNEFRQENPGIPPTASMCPPDDELEKRWGYRLKKQLGEEMADLYTYMDLLAQKAGINLSQEVIDKFNLVSLEMNCPQYTYIP